MSRESEAGLAVSTERRQWSRLPIAIPIFVRGTDRWGKSFVELATVLNIGAGGALLATSRRLEKGSELLLEIPVGLFPQTLLPKLVRQMRAQLLRIDPAEKYCLAGVQFVHPLSA